MDDEMLSEAIDTAVTACDKFPDNLEAAAQMLKVRTTLQYKKYQCISNCPVNVENYSRRFHFTVLYRKQKSKWPFQISILI